MIPGLLLDRRCGHCDSLVSLDRRADSRWAVRIAHDSTCWWYARHVSRQAR